MGCGDEGVRGRERKRETHLCMCQLPALAPAVEAEEQKYAAPQVELRQEEAVRQLSEAGHAVPACVRTCEGKEMRRKEV